MSQKSCRAETRSQGIATVARGRNFIGGEIRLAEPRPVLRGLRPRIRFVPSSMDTPNLQSRDPFSGDCDDPGRSSTFKNTTSPLQSRDPFSGDCDPSSTAARMRAARARLAEPRPVLRGLRRPSFFGDLDAGEKRLQSRDPFSGDCDGMARASRRLGR